MGLPRCGAMDPAMLARANSLAGNLPDAAGIEWALSPGTLRPQDDAVLVVLGAGRIALDGVEVAREHPVVRAPGGSRVDLEPDPEVRFLYIAFRGGIDVSPLLGSRSTYLPGGFGGFEGRKLKAGDLLPVGPAPLLELGGTIHLQSQPAAETGDLMIRVIPGPQWDHFTGAAQQIFREGRYQVARASDRMGYRLEGPVISPERPTSLPSEAACPGAIQVPGDGQPIVLMPDGPTVGGYPKIAVVLQADLGILAQAVPGRWVRFESVER
jgi:antagonist of KipI